MNFGVGGFGLGLGAHESVPPKQNFVAVPLDKVII